MSTLTIHNPLKSNRLRESLPHGQPPDRSPPGVLRAWERLWTHVPSDRRDDALIARERRSLRWKLVQQRLRAAFGSLAGLRTIELGSGRGDLSLLLAQAGAKVTLLDGSARALQQARHRFDRLNQSCGGIADARTSLTQDSGGGRFARRVDASFVQGDLFECNPSWAGEYDVALSSGVIEHFAGETRTAAVAAHRTALRKGGLAIISVPNAWCLPYRLWKSYLEIRGWWPYGFERPYSARELADRARRVGLDNVFATSIGFLQSVGDHLGRGVFGRGADFADRASCLDPLMGMSVVLFGQRT